MNKFHNIKKNNKNYIYYNYIEKCKIILDFILWNLSANLQKKEVYNSCKNIYVMILKY